MRYDEMIHGLKSVGHRLELSPDATRAAAPRLTDTALIGRDVSLSIGGLADIIDEAIAPLEARLGALEAQALGGLGTIVPEPRKSVLPPRIRVPAGRREVVRVKAISRAIA